MAEEPVYSNTYLLPRSLFEHSKIWAGIDFGCSLLKLAFVSKKEALDTSVDPVTVQCHTYRKSQFDAMLRMLKDTLHVPTDGVLHVTGVGCTHHAKDIKSVLGVDIEFIQEILAGNRGAHILVTHSKHEDIFHNMKVGEKRDIVLPDEVRMMFELMRQKYTKNDPKDGSPFPALYMQVGSGSMLSFIDADGKSRFVSGIPSAGKTFLGLSRLLLGTADYDEITAKAAAGSRMNTDLCVREMVADDPNSPYGQYPSDTAIMPFGKAVDQDRGLDDFNPNDIAAGMVGLVSSQIFFFTMSASELCGVSRVYVGGGWCRSEVARKEILKAANSLMPGMVQFSFLKSEQTGAVGAMLTNAADMMKYVTF